MLNWDHEDLKSQQYKKKEKQEVISEYEFEEKVKEYAKENWKVRKLLEIDGGFKNWPQILKEDLYRRIGYEPRIVTTYVKIEKD